VLLQDEQCYWHLLAALVQNELQEFPFASLLYLVHSGCGQQPWHVLLMLCDAEP